MNTAVLLALGASLLWGSADYLGGRASGSIPALRASLLSHVAGASIAMLGVLIIRPEMPATRGWLLLIVVGVTGALGLAGLFRALADGHAASAAPLAAVIGASGPVIAGLARGERLGGTAVLGVLLALPAAGLLCASPPGPTRHGPARSEGRRSLWFAAAAGACFAVYYVALDATSDVSKWWIAGIGNTTGALCLLLVALVAGVTVTGPVPRSALTAAAISGPVYLMGTALFVTASSGGGELALIGPAASLYPLATVAIGRFADGLRLYRVQIFGATMAISAMVLMSVG